MPGFARVAVRGHPGLVADHEAVAVAIVQQSQVAVLQRIRLALSMQPAFAGLHVCALGVEVLQEMHELVQQDRAIERARLGNQVGVEKDAFLGQVPSLHRAGAAADRALDLGAAHPRHARGRRRLFVARQARYRNRAACRPAPTSIGFPANRQRPRWASHADRRRSRRMSRPCAPGAAWIRGGAGRPCGQGPEAPTGRSRRTSARVYANEQGPSTGHERRT